MRCAKAYDTGWGGCLKTIGFFIANEVSRFDLSERRYRFYRLQKNMEQIAEHPLEENLAALCRPKKITRSKH